MWKHFSLNMIRHLGPFANNFNLLLQGHFSYQWFASGLSILNRHEVNRNLEPKEKRCITYRFRIVYLMCLLRCIIREEVVLPGRRKLFPMWIYLLLVITGWVLLSCIAKQDRIFFFSSKFVSICFLLQWIPRHKQRSTFELDGALLSLTLFQWWPPKRLETVPLSCVLEVACERARFLWESNKNPSEDLLEFRMLADEISAPRFFSFFSFSNNIIRW